MTTRLVRAFRTANQRQFWAALAALARELLPDPPLKAPAVETDSEPAMLSEVRQKLFEILRVPPNTDLAPEQLSDALDLVNASLSYIVLHGDESQVRARLGDKGLLSSNQYRIQYSDLFRTYEQSVGVRRSHVQTLITQPDAVQHIHLREARESESFSVFARTARESSQTNPYILLAISKRIGDVQEVYDVFRVYHEDVPIRPGSTPLDLLRAFVNEYGCLIQVGESPWAKFFYDNVFPVNADGGNFIRTDTSSLPPGTDVKGTYIFRVNELNIIEVALAFGLNITRYRDALIKRGVPVGQLPIS